MCILVPFSQSVCKKCGFDAGPVGFVRTILVPTYNIYTVFFQIDTGIEIRIGSSAFNMNSLLASSSIANVSRLGCARSFCMFFA